MSAELVHAGPALAFDVVGIPQTQGSKTAITNPKTGKALVVESGNRVAKRTWRGDVRDAAKAAIWCGDDDGDWWHGAYTPTFDGPCRVEMTFRRPRPKSHYGTGRNSDVLKPSAPMFPTGAPDLLKLARALEDALTGVVYLDDAQIVEETLRKEYGPPGASVVVTQL